MDSPLSSAAFRRWFGNSRVVDARGEPMVVYHGTPKPLFSEFRMAWHEHSGQQVPFGIHFAEKTSLANEYANGEDPDLWLAMGKVERAAQKRVLTRLGYKSGSDFFTKLRRSPGSPKHLASQQEVRAAIKRATDAARLRLAGGDFRRVIPVYLSIQRPLDARERLISGTGNFELAKQMLGDGWDRFLELRGRIPIQRAIDESHPREAHQAIVDAGYDGIVYTAHYLGNYLGNAAVDLRVKSWVAFDPRQIKHATENVGMYDPSDPDMYKNPRRKTSRRQR